MMSKEDLTHRLEFVGITGPEAARLRALRPLLERSAGVLGVDFYRHLLCFPETRHLLKDPRRRKRLFEGQRAQLLGLSRTALDDEYLEERRRIGESYEELGLPPGWHLGAQAECFALLALLIEEAVQGEVGELRLLLVALVRRILLDAQLSIEAYVERRDRRLEDEDRSRGEQEGLGLLRSIRTR
jgi:hypothetical protein